MGCGHGTVAAVHCRFLNWAIANAMAVCSHPPIDLSDETAIACTSKGYGEALAPQLLPKHYLLDIPGRQCPRGLGILYAFHLFAK